MLTKEFNFLCWNIICWHFFKITSVLENIRWLSMIVPRYLYCITVSTSNQWIPVERAAAKSLASGDGHHHHLGFSDTQLQLGGCQVHNWSVSRKNMRCKSTQPCGESVEVMRRADRFLSTRTVSVLWVRISRIQRKRWSSRVKFWAELLHYNVG